MTVKEKLFHLSLFIVLFVLSHKMLTYLVSLDDINRTKQQVSLSLATVQDAVDEITDALLTLNEFGFTTCSDSNLLEMRKNIFWARYIKDIGFFENEVITCTTSLGALKDVFINDEDPNVIDKRGFQYWRDAKLFFLESKHVGSLVRYNQYNAVIDPSQMFSTIDSNYNYQLNILTKEGYQYWLGHRGLVMDEGVIEKRVTNSKNFTKCTRDGQLCLTLELKPNITRVSYPREQLFIFIVSLFICCFTSFTLFLYQKRRHSIDVRVRHSVNNGLFHCVYQPVVCLKTGKIIGLEMLARHHDKYGSLEPEQFIPIIKKLGLTWQFTQFITQKALVEIKESELSINPDFKLSFNVFSVDISSGIISQLLLLSEITLFEGVLVIEVMESRLLETNSAQSTLIKLQQSGFLIAIDDFGTGYSNLNQLKKINSDILKIDESFIIDVEDGAIRSSLISHIVNIAHQQNMAVIAEGVENSLQHQVLLDMGVEYGQGWAFGRPVAVDELSTLV